MCVCVCGLLGLITSDFGLTSFIETTWLGERLALLFSPSAEEAGWEERKSLNKKYRCFFCEIKQASEIDT